MTRARTLTLTGRSSTFSREPTRPHRGRAEDRSFDPSVHCSDHASEDGAWRAQMAHKARHLAAERVVVYGDLP